MNTGQPKTDELLVLRCRQGDAEALNELLRGWQEPLWRYALRLTGNEDAAWDVLQETLNGIARNVNRLEADAGGGLTVQNWMLEAPNVGTYTLQVISREATGRWQVQIDEPEANRTAPNPL